jgi:hypothetical protein
MADIFLKYKKNRKLYAAMYQELAEQGLIHNTFVITDRPVLISCCWLCAGVYGVCGCSFAGKTVHGYILLGEAYMRIQEPDKVTTPPWRIRTGSLRVVNPYRFGAFRRSKRTRTR